MKIRRQGPQKKKERTKHQTEHSLRLMFLISIWNHFQIFPGVEGGVEGRNAKLWKIHQEAFYYWNGWQVSEQRKAAARQAQDPEGQRCVFRRRDSHWGFFVFTNGPKEYSKLVNKTSHTGTEPQLGNEGRGSVAKLKSEMKSICVSLGSRWAVLEPTLVLASSSVLAARCSVWQSWRIQNPCAHYNYQ